MKASSIKKPSEIGITTTYKPSAISSVAADREETYMVTEPNGRERKMVSSHIPTETFGLTASHKASVNIGENTKLPSVSADSFGKSKDPSKKISKQ